MEANVGSASVTIMPTMDGFTASMNKALGSAGSSGASAFTKSFSKGASGVAGGVSKAVGGVGSAIRQAAGVAAAALGTVGFASIVSEAAEATDATQKFASTLTFAGLDTSGIEALSKSTRAYADETVYSLADIQNVTAQLAANGVKDYDRLAEAAGNLNAVSGGNADTFKSVGMVLTQTAGQGKLTTENWNQLADAIPGASGKIQQALLDMGAYTGNFREAMEDGEISAEEFNDALMQLGFEDAAVEAAKSTKTFEGAMGNLQAALVGGFSDVLTAAQPAITGVINGATSMVEAFSGAISDTISDVSEFEQTAGRVATAGDVVWIAVQNIGQAAGLTYDQLLPVADGLASVADGVQGFFDRLSENGAVQTFCDMVGQLGGAALDAVAFVGELVGALTGVSDGADPATAAADGLKGALDGLQPVVQGIADACAWLRDNASAAAPYVVALAGAFGAVRIVQGVSGFVSAFSSALGGVGAAAAPAASALGGLGGAAAMSAPQILALGGAIALVGAGVLLASAGLALLAASAIQLAAAGPAAAVGSNSTK